ncbi:MAG: zinc-ribbon domain-containing protein [Candidatus Bathyarchaeia archaeon]
MVYCSKCGTKNPDDATVCSQCGAPLYTVKERWHHRRHEGECFGPEEECFGIPRGGAVLGLAIGLIILIAGFIWLLQQAQLIPKTVEFWPFAVIIFGILIIVGAIYGLRRKF